MSRIIVIEVVDANEFKVIEGDRYQDKMCWDEMLGQIAEMTHPKIGVGRYPMLTAIEWKGRRE